MNEPAELTPSQLVTVAQRSGVRHRDVSKVLEAINDVIFNDPEGTIRRSPDGRIIAIRTADMGHPWKTWCPKGSASWRSDSITSWPIVFSPEAS